MMPYTADGKSRVQTALIKSFSSLPDAQMALIVIWTLFFYLLQTPAARGASLEPTFDVPLVNVTVVAGQSIVLQCSIDNLGKNKVAWLDQNSFPLTLEDRRTIDDPRFSIVRPYLKEWNLLISEVRRTDSGPYRCTVNTDPVRSKIVILHVKVPPQIIIDPGSASSEIVVREGDTVRLSCNATGVPHPEVTWFRRSANSGRYPYAVERLGGGGSAETLVVVNVSRFLGELYECVASNGVPPAVSRQIRVVVQYAPEINLPNRRIGQKQGREVVLECFVAAVPPATLYWRRVTAARSPTVGGSMLARPWPGSDATASDGVALVTSDKHITEEYEEEVDGSTNLRLSIRNLQPADYGDYQCVASNLLGRTDKTISVYEYRDPESVYTVPTPMDVGHHGNTRSRWHSSFTSATTVIMSHTIATYRTRTSLTDSDKSRSSVTDRRQSPIVSFPMFERALESASAAERSATSTNILPISLLLAVLLLTTVQW